MKASSIITSVIFFFLALATTSTSAQEAVLDSKGNPINREHRCKIKARYRHLNFGLLKSHKGMEFPFVNMDIKFDAAAVVSDPVTFHPEEAAHLNENLTTLTPYGIKFDGSDKFWKLAKYTLRISETGVDVSYSGTFTMKRTSGDLEYPEYQLFYHGRRGYDVRTEFVTGGPYMTIDTPEYHLIKELFPLQFSFHECAPV